MMAEGIRVKITNLELKVRANKNLDTKGEAPPVANLRGGREPGQFGITTLTSFYRVIQT